MYGRKDENHVSSSGVISKEMNEIRKMQETTPLILSIVTNTCSDFLTIFCC